MGNGITTLPFRRTESAAGNLPARVIVAQREQPQEPQAYCGFYVLLGYCLKMVDPLLVAKTSRLLAFLLNGFFQVLFMFSWGLQKRKCAATLPRVGKNGQPKRKPTIAGAPLTCPTLRLQHWIRKLEPPDNSAHFLLACKGRQKRRRNQP